MNIIGWVAFYTGNRTFSSDLHKWEELPKVGVLAVAVLFNKTTPTGHRYKEIISGRRRYFMATGSSGNTFIKGSLWTEKKLLGTYSTKAEWIKEGIWDDEKTMYCVMDKVKEVTFDGSKPIIPDSD